MQLHIFSASQKRNCSLYYEKIAFSLKKKRCVILGLKISDFGGNTGVFFSSKIREKGVFFKLGYDRGIIIWSGVCVCVWWVVGCWVWVLGVGGGMAWCFSTRASVATVLSTHPFVPSCWWQLSLFTFTVGITTSLNITQTYFCLFIHDSWFLWQLAFSLLLGHMPHA